MMIAWAASRNRCTRCAARSFAVLIDRSTARCFHAGSSLGLLTGCSDAGRLGRTWMNCTGERLGIAVLDPLAATLFEIGTSSLREYYSQSRLYRRPARNGALHASVDTSDGLGPGCHPRRARLHGSSENPPANPAVCDCFSMGRRLP